MAKSQCADIDDEEGIGRRVVGREGNVCAGLGETLPMLKRPLTSDVWFGVRVA